MRQLQTRVNEYRGRGWSPIPVRIRSKEPKLPKGHPFLRRKPTEEEFDRFDFRDNLAIVTGRVSRLVVLDDDDNGETLRKNGWHVPATPHVKTRRGHQYYMRCPEDGFPTFDVVPGHLEVRADGAYVVAPPSIHPSGERYEWVISPDEAELADPPAWLIKQASMRGRRMHAEDVGEVIANGSRNKTLFSIAGTLRRRGLDEPSIAAALLGINALKCETPLPEDEVRKIARSAARYDPPDPPPRDTSRNTPKGHSDPTTLAGRVLLGEGIAGELEPPDELEPGILLRGKVHSVYAGPGTGKTMMMLWAVKRCLGRGQAVVVMDMENGPRILSERLRGLGVDPERADALLHYFPSPNLPLTDEARDSYAALLDEVNPALVVFDSWLNFLASAGMDENSSNDVAGWAVSYTHPARNRGITVLLLDHIPHEGSHARGSTRKKDEVDVMWRLHNTQPFDRDSVGEIVLHREKDREAWLPPSVRFSVGGGSDGFVFKRSAGTIEETAEGDLTDRQKKALDVLRGFGRKGARYSEWKRGSGLKGTTFDRAISALTVRGLVRKVDGKYYPRRQPDGDGPRGGSTSTSTPGATPVTENGESGLSKGNSENPHEPPSNPREQNGGSGDLNPRHPHPSKGRGGGGNSSEAPSEGFTPREPRLTKDQEQRYHRLVREGMSENLAREEVLGKAWVRP